MPEEIQTSKKSTSISNNSRLFQPKSSLTKESRSNLSEINERNLEDKQSLNQNGKFSEDKGSSERKRFSKKPSEIKKESDGKGNSTGSEEDDNEFLKTADQQSFGERGQSQFNLDQQLENKRQSTEQNRLSENQKKSMGIGTVGESRNSRASKVSVGSGSINEDGKQIIDKYSVGSGSLNEKRDSKANKVSVGSGSVNEPLTSRVSKYSKGIGSIIKTDDTEIQSKNTQKSPENGSFEQQKTSTKTNELMQETQNEVILEKRVSRNSFNRNSNNQNLLEQSRNSNLMENNLTENQNNTVGRKKTSQIDDRNSITNEKYSEMAFDKFSESQRRAYDDVREAEMVYRKAMEDNGGSISGKKSSELVLDKFSERQRRAYDDLKEAEMMYKKAMEDNGNSISGKKSSELTLDKFSEGQRRSFGLRSNEEEIDSEPNRKSFGGASTTAKRNSKEVADKVSMITSNQLVTKNSTKSNNEGFLKPSQIEKNGQATFYDENEHDESTNKFSTGNQANDSIVKNGSIIANKELVKKSTDQNYNLRTQNQEIMLKKDKKNYNIEEEMEEEQNEKKVTYSNPPNMSKEQEFNILLAGYNEFRKSTTKSNKNSFGDNEFITDDKEQAIPRLSKEHADEIRQSILKLLGENRASMPAELVKRISDEMNNAQNDPNLIDQFYQFCREKLPTDKKYKESVMLVSLFYYFLEKRQMLNRKQGQKLG